MELLGQDRLELLLARGFYFVIKGLCPKLDITIEELMDFSLVKDRQLSAEEEAHMLERTFGEGEPANADDLAMIAALSAQFELAQ